MQIVDRYIILTMGTLLVMISRGCQLKQKPPFCIVYRQTVLSNVQDGDWKKLKKNSSGKSLKDDLLICIIRDHG
jgi:hypothetical protein